MITEAVKRLRRVVGAMRAGTAIPPGDALLLAEAIEQALAGNIDLDIAVGLAVSSPFSREALSRRSKLILQLSRMYDGTLSGRAKQMAAAAQHYATTVWPRLRITEQSPVIPPTRVEEILYLLQSEAEAGGARWPLVWRSIVDVLEPLQPVRWDCKLIATPTRGS